MADSIWSKPAYEGKFERVKDRCVIGWIRDSNNPSLTIFVEVRIDGLLVCTGAANIPRGDLSRMGIGTGAHGFNICLPDWIDYTVDQHIRISVVGASVETPGWALINPAEVPPSEVTFSIPSNVFVHSLSKPDTSLTPKGAKGLVGKDNWLFLCHDSNDVVGQLGGAHQLTEEHVRQYSSAFKKRKEFFEAHNILYKFFVAPTKEVIYDDKLPEGYNIEYDKFPAKIILDLALNSDIDALYLKDAVRHARSNGEEVFHRTDTHWTVSGAYAAYREIYRRLSDTIKIGPAVEWSELTLAETGAYRGDLSDKRKVALMPNHKPNYLLLAEDAIAPATFSERIIRVAGQPNYHSSPVDNYLRVSKTRETIVHENDDQSLPRAVVFRDSFTIALIPFLSRHFSRIVYIWKPEPDFEIIERERPDVVMNINLDRFLRLIPNQ